MNSIRRNQLKTEAICEGVWGILGESAENVPAPSHSPLTQPKKQKPAVLSERRNTITERVWKEFIKGSSYTAEKGHFIYGDKQENTCVRERQVEGSHCDGVTRATLPLSGSHGPHSVGCPSTFRSISLVTTASPASGPGRNLLLPHAGSKIWEAHIRESPSLSNSIFFLRFIIYLAG